MTGVRTGPPTEISGGLRTFELNPGLPIAVGDSVGIDVTAGPVDPMLFGPRAGAAYLYESPLVADGATSTGTGPVDDFEVMINADVEPDCDADLLGDETQDSDLSSCAPQPDPTPKADGTLTIDANKGKVEKGRKVLLSGQLDVAANESCEQNRQIQIQRRLKSEDDSKFATFATVNTDATGNYSLKVKAKKTYFYRAVVAETDVCDDETSNSQKVRVQKRKAAQEA